MRLPRWLCWLLTLCLVPTVGVVSSLSAAVAATAYGDVATVTLKTNDCGGGGIVCAPGGSTECNFSGYWGTDDSGIATLRLSYNCGTDWAISTSTVGVAANGTGCGLLPQLAQVGQVDGGASGSVNMAPTLDTAVNPACSIDQLCMTSEVKYHENPFNTETQTDCEAFALGTPPVNGGGGTCPTLTPHGSPNTLGEFVGDDGGRYQQADIDWDSTAGDEADNVYVYLVMRRVDGTTFSTIGAPAPRWLTQVGSETVWSTGGGGQIDGHPQLGATPQAAFAHVTGVYGGVQIGQGVTKDVEIIGAGIADWTYLHPGSNDVTSARAIRSSTTGDNGVLGVNDPANCTFYWGTRIDNLPDDKGVPQGTLNQTDGPPDSTPLPPDGGSSGCASFSLTDPTSWAGAGICELVKVLRSAVDLLGNIYAVLQNVLSALANLASTIAGAIASALAGLAGAIGDVIAGLFVPSPGFFADQTAGVKHAWDDSAPWTIFTGVGGVLQAASFAQPSNACAGPTWSFNAPIAGPTSLHPLSACGAGLSTFSTVVKAGLEVGLWVGAALLGFRVLAASVGLNLPKGDSE